MVDKMKVACFSGHRELPDDCTELKKNLKETITKLIVEEGVIHFGAGGALGFDQLAAEMVIKLRRKYPFIKLSMVLPCPAEQQTLKWNTAQKKSTIK